MNSPQTLELGPIEQPDGPASRQSQYQSELIGIKRGIEKLKSKINPEHETHRYQATIQEPRTPDSLVLKLNKKIPNSKKDDTNTEPIGTEN